MLKSAAVTIATSLFLAAPAPAQSATAGAWQGQNSSPVSHIAGFQLGLAASGSAIKADGSDVTENGGGLALRAGWGFTENLALFAEGQGAQISGADDSQDYTLAHFDLGGRAYFANSASALRPYLQLAYSGRAMAIEFGDET